MRKRQCTSCGEYRWGEVCQPCRRAARGLRLCELCGQPRRSIRAARYCSIECSAKADSARRRAMRSAATTPQQSRRDREYAAIGLSHHARRKLLRRWIKQGRRCTYCDRPADTVDHAVPLIRGGTNYEGNLVPACRSCNSRKNDRLIVEYRWGVTASRSAMPLRIKKPRPPKPERVVTFAECYICGTTYIEGKRRRTCGGECAYEHAKRIARENYRAKVGLEPTWDIPTGQAWERKRSA